VQRIAGLYASGAQIRGKPPDARKAMRQTHAAPLLADNAAERALRSIAIGRKSWLLAGSHDGGEPAATIPSLIGTAKLVAAICTQHWRQPKG
jgi:hypothetical protein